MPHVTRLVSTAAGNLAPRPAGPLRRGRFGRSPAGVRMYVPGESALGAGGAIRAVAEGRDCRRTPFTWTKSGGRIVEDQWKET